MRQSIQFGLTWLKYDLFEKWRNNEAYIIYNPVDNSFENVIYDHNLIEYRKDVVNEYYHNGGVKMAGSFIGNLIDMSVKLWIDIPVTFDEYLEVVKSMGYYTDIDISPDKTWTIFSYEEIDG